MIYQFNIPIEPVAKGRPRFSRRGFCYTPTKTRNYESDLKDMLKFKLKSRDLYDKPISLTLNFFILKPKSVKREYPCVKPDIDNYVKAFLDAANGVIFHDDGQIISLTASKRYHEKPGIDVYIESKQ